MVLLALRRWGMAAGGPAAGRDPTANFLADHDRSGRTAPGPASRTRAPAPETPRPASRRVALVARLRTRGPVPTSQIAIRMPECALAGFERRTARRGGRAFERCARCAGGSGARETSLRSARRSAWRRCRRSDGGNARRPNPAARNSSAKRFLIGEGCQCCRRDSDRRRRCPRPRRRDGAGPGRNRRRESGRSAAATGRLNSRQSNLPPGLENPPRLGERGGPVGDVPEAEGDGAGIRRQRAGRAAPRRDRRRSGCRRAARRPTARSIPTVEHFEAGIADDDLRLRHGEARRARCLPCRPRCRSPSSPARGSSQSIINAFHTRWRPPLIRSFIRS